MMNSMGGMIDHDIAEALCEFDSEIESKIKWYRDNQEGFNKWQAGSSER